MAEIISMKETMEKITAQEQETERRAISFSDLTAVHMLACSTAAERNIASIEDGRDLLKNIIMRAGTILTDAGIGARFDLTTAAADLFGQPIEYIAGELIDEENTPFLYGKDGDMEYLIQISMPDGEDENAALDEHTGELSYYVLLFRLNEKAGDYHVFTDDGWKPCSRSFICLD